MAVCGSSWLLGIFLTAQDPLGFSASYCSLDDPGYLALFSMLSALLTTLRRQLDAVLPVWPFWPLDPLPAVWRPLDPSLAFWLRSALLGN